MLMAGLLVAARWGPHICDTARKSPHSWANYSVFEYSKGVQLVFNSHSMRRYVGKETADFIPREPNIFDLMHPSIADQLVEEIW
jgi:hypothetical protein